MEVEPKTKSMKFQLKISTDSQVEDIKDRCLEAVAKVLEEDGSYFGVSYEVGSPTFGLVKRSIEYGERSE